VLLCLPLSAGHSLRLGCLGGRACRRRESACVRHVGHVRHGMVLLPCLDSCLPPPAPFTRHYVNIWPCTRQVSAMTCSSGLAGLPIQGWAAHRLCSRPLAPAASTPASAAQRRCGWRRPAPHCHAAAQCQTSDVQQVSVLETDSEEPAVAPNGIDAKPGDALSALSDAAAADDAAAAERRASGQAASTSQAGIIVEPVAVARCHTLAAEVCRPGVTCHLHELCKQSTNSQRHMQS
jgi:hypothetical protein